MRLMVVLMALTASGLLAGPQSPTVETGYVGSNACKACHPAITVSYYKNPHYKQMASASDEHRAEAGCESCHGPGKAHVEGRGLRSAIKAFSTMEPAAILENCLRCHSQTISRANIRRSAHTQNDVVCTSCHGIHKAVTPKALLSKPQTDLCYTCHASVKAQFSMPFKHRVNEGFMKCSDCHNPHGAAAPTWRMASRPRMVDSSGNEEPCLRCHTDKRGPFVFEHAAVRVDGCESCHSPHGSTNARLLRRPVVLTLCLECHNGLGSFGRSSSGVPSTSSSHSLSDPRYQNCTTCHVRIHGSNADSRFLR
ncbi:MAG: DmsE family decaheme c-type cytochrome [Bryobacteraceae bacterium]